MHWPKFPTKTGARTILLLEPFHTLVYLSCASVYPHCYIMRNIVCEVSEIRGTCKVIRTLLTKQRNRRRELQNVYKSKSLTKES